MVVMLKKLIQTAKGTIWGTYCRNFVSVASNELRTVAMIGKGSCDTACYLMSFSTRVFRPSISSMRSILKNAFNLSNLWLHGFLLPGGVESHQQGLEDGSKPGKIGSATLPSNLHKHTSGANDCTRL